MLSKKPKGLSRKRCCQLLKVPRSSSYYVPRTPNHDDLMLMRLIDEQYLKMPCYGSRSMTRYLRRNDYLVSRKRVRRLMRLMDITAIYPRPRTSKPHPEHKIYPYLLRGLEINCPNQVWATDITYIPMKRGFMYLVAILDWHSRKVLSWRLSNTLHADFCIDALDAAIRKYGAPQIFNTDQGSQFTGKAFIKKLKDHDIRISMDGRGRFLDNIFIERLWWTVKYQYVYLREFKNGRELYTGLKEWFRFYNEDRGHESLNDKTPDEIYLAVKEAA